MKIGIFDGCVLDISVDENTKFLGGSETWLNKISEAFSDLGHEVFLFVNTPVEHDFKNVHYLKKESFDKVCATTEFDYFYYSRGIKGMNKVKCKNISLMMHDMGLFHYPGEAVNFGKLKHIFVLSNWHKTFMEMQYNIPKASNFVKVTLNGIDMDLYKDVDMTKKTNSMVWSSCFERGLDFFIKLVYPRIKAEVPDFELKICSYNKYDIDAPGIINLGRLTKPELAEVQKTAKIWCYPNLGISAYGLAFKETFCISAVENAAAGNCILTTSLGGMGTTCKGVNFLSSEFYDDSEMIDDMYSYAYYLAYMCVKALKEDYFTSFNYRKYTWENAAKSLME